MNETRQPIDITTLAWEPTIPAKDSLPFDPEVDITEEDWRIILNDFRDEKESLLRTHTPLNFKITSIAAAVALLSPQKIPQLGLEEIPQEKLATFLEERREAGPVFESFAHHLAKTKIGFQKTCEQLGITPTDWQNMKRELETFRKESWPLESFLDLGHNLAILYPNRTGELDLNDEFQQKSLQLIKSFKAAKHWASFAEYTAFYKILFPHHTSDLEAELDQATWQQLKTDYPNRRDRTTPLLLCRAFTNLAVLSAQKVEITDHGIELLFDRSEPFTQPTPPPPPPVRKF